jgi:hypothetical protein
MTPDQINKRFASLAGLCWHEWIQNDSAFARVEYYCKHCAQGADYPEAMEDGIDFCGDPRLVIEVMMKRDGFTEFIDSLVPISGSSVVGFIKMFIMDTTGKLALAAIEWMEENDPHAKAMAEWRAMNYMQQGGNKETRKTQRPILELEYPDYNPVRHDVFVLRHNHELEKHQTERYWVNRGIIPEVRMKESDTLEIQWSKSLVKNHLPEKDVIMRDARGGKLVI